MKVLLDANVSYELQEYLVDALGHDIHVAHTIRLGWRKKSNGKLQDAAVAAGYTVLVTHDKSMAERHEPKMPVIVVDLHSQHSAFQRSAFRSETIARRFFFSRMETARSIFRPHASCFQLSVA